MRLKIETSRLTLCPFELIDAEAAFGSFGQSSRYAVHAERSRRVHRSDQDAAGHV
jgi:hypothetical protein